MRDGFIRVGAATSNVVVANPIENARNIIEKISKASRNKVRVLTFQELALSGYTCGDLFLQDTLLDGCLEGLEMIRKYSVTKDMLIVVGLPMKNNNKIYNVAAFINKGNYLGFVPKTFIPNYEDFYETRYFTKPGKNTTININGTNYPFGTNLLFKCNNMPSLVAACEIGEDLYAPISPSTHHALNGANVILNLAASSEVLTSAKERVDFIRNHSKKIIASYIYASAGEGESTQDSVFASHNIIAENGVILKESELFKNELVFVEVDTKYLSFERSKKDMFALEESEYTIVHFDISNKETPISREFDKAPFSPKDEKDLDKILLIQAYGLKKRIEHTHTKKLILGLSGGLDSTLAVLVMAKSLELLNRSNKDILAVSMPCFGTTDLTKTNAYKLAKALGVTFKEINIKASVTQHFKDIEQDIDNYDVTYENETIEDTYYRDHLLLEESVNNAIIVGFTKAGKKVEIVSSKLLVTYVDGEALTNLKLGDEIINIDGIEITSATEINDVISKKEVNDEIVLKVISDKKEVTKEEKLREENGRVVIGILATEKKEIETIPEVELKFKKSESGPSGGLMTALAIYNYLTPEDITHGKTIVGTGTIDVNGKVGSIGGVKYKLKGAVKNKAEIFIVPNGENYKEAIKLKEENNYQIEIIGVDTIDDALNYLMDL